MRVRRRASLVVLAALGVIAALATFSVVQADQGTDRFTRVVTGGVESINTGNSTFVVRTGSGQVTVSVPSALSGRDDDDDDDDDDRRGRIVLRQANQVSDLAVNDRILVQGRYDNSTFVARRILVLSSTPAVQTQSGRIEGTFVSFSTSDNKLTLSVNGANRAFTVNGNTRVRPVDKSVANLLSLAGGTRVAVNTARGGDVARVVRIEP